MLINYHKQTERNNSEKLLKTRFLNEKRKYQYITSKLDMKLKSNESSIFYEYL